MNDRASPMWIGTVSFFTIFHSIRRKNPRTPEFSIKSSDMRVLKIKFQKNAFLQSYNPTNLFSFQTYIIYISIYINTLHYFSAFLPQDV